MRVGVSWHALSCFAAGELATAGSRRKRPASVLESAGECSSLALKEAAEKAEEFL